MRQKVFAVTGGASGVGLAVGAGIDFLAALSSRPTQREAISG
jgi:hypothetical protein